MAKSETKPLLQEQSFEQMTADYSGNVLTNLQNLWNNCVDKSEADLMAIIKAFKPQLERWSSRLLIARIENGDPISDTVMESQKKFPTSDFKAITMPPKYGANGRLPDVTRYVLKSGIGHLNVDRMTLKQFNQVKKEFDADTQEFLETAEAFRKAEADWAKLKKDPDAYTEQQFGQLKKIKDEATKAYDAGLIKIGLTRARFDVKGNDVKDYIKGLQLAKKGEIQEYSSRVQALRAQITIVTAILNKKRGNQLIEKVRSAGNINTGMIDSEIENLITLPAEVSKVTAKVETSKDAQTSLPTA